MTDYRPNMDLTSIFKLNKKIDVPEHIGFYTKPTFHKNDMHFFINILNQHPDLTIIQKHQSIIQK